MKFCFVILHYLGSADTIECINSIESLNGGTTANIVIVDNFSNNGSIEEVAEYVAKYPNCTILKNQQNLGFAKGNNVGYLYAKQNFSNSFIIVLNNDTVIQQLDFLKKIESRYNSDSFAVLGPDIVSLIDGGHQNPLTKIPDKKSVVKQIRKYRVLLFLSKIGMYEFFQKRFGRKSDARRIRDSKPNSAVIHDMALHGSCLVFSPKFIDSMDEAFCPDTFLYKEEFILAQRCKEKSLKMFFDSSIEIYHKEDSSTNQIVSCKKEKREFLFRNLIQSDKVLLRYL